MNDQPHPTPAPSGPVQTAVARILSREYTSSDYPEDAAHENGNYVNHCLCGAEFIGHKRRQWCKVCGESPTPPQPAQEPAEGYWECQRCGEQVPPSHVTYAEHHDGQCGGAVEWVDVKPAPEPTQGIAREWVQSETEHFGMGHSGRALRECAALELADRADAAELRLSEWDRLIKHLNRDNEREQERCARLAAQLAAAERTVERLRGALELAHDRIIYHAPLDDALTAIGAALAKTKEDQS